MPTWHNLSNFLTDEIPAASDLNEILDNMEWLHAPPTGKYEQSSATDLTTASGTWAVISSDFEITITTSGGNVLCLFMGAIDNLDIDFSLDGTRLTTTTTTGAGAIRNDGAAAFTQSVMLPVLYTGVAAGSHTFAVQWKASSGTGTLAGAFQPRFYARELA